MGVVLLFGWILIGLIVAGIEKAVRPGRHTDDMTTVLCVAGALAGGVAGQAFRLYVFGQPLGFVFAAAGAELLLYVYRRRAPAQPPEGEDHPPPDSTPRSAPPAAPLASLGTRLVEAFAWGMLCGLAVAVCGVFGHFLAAKLYPQRYEQIPSDFSSPLSA